MAAISEGPFGQMSRSIAPHTSTEPSEDSGLDVCVEMQEPLQQDSDSGAHPLRQSWAELSAEPRWCCSSWGWSLLCCRLADGQPLLQSASCVRVLSGMLRACRP